MLGRKRFKPKLFYHVSLDRLVPDDDFYRRLNELLDLSYLYHLCSPFYGTTGNPSIDPVVPTFVGIKFVGYLENITSNPDSVGTKRVADSLTIPDSIGTISKGPGKRTARRNRRQRVGHQRAKALSPDLSGLPPRASPGGS